MLCNTIIDKTVYSYFLLILSKIYLDSAPFGLGNSGPEKKNLINTYDHPTNNIDIIILYVPNKYVGTTGGYT